MPRAFLIVLDSFGIGGAHDAADFGDEGANTLGHIAAECVAGQADNDRRQGPLHLPNMAGLGLAEACYLAGGIRPVITRGARPALTGRWAAGCETSRGKDTPSGHWELAGVPVPWEWGYFPNQTPAFPPFLVDQICALAHTSGILGNCHMAGLPAIEQFGAQHLRTGWPICYTSVDSVLQIAAHEQAFGLDRLYQLCADLAPILHAMRIGRVIARPFSGTEDHFTRTPNRRDYAMAPPAPTLLNWADRAGCTTYAIGKIYDIFSGHGIHHHYKGCDDAALFDHLDHLALHAGDNSLIFANFVDFDTLYGHTRDVAGYACALEWFDRRMGYFLSQMRAGDLAVFTADHGNDPTWQGTDHTRERVPVLIAGAGAGGIGLCGFTDVAHTIACHLNITPLGQGCNLLI